MFWVGKTQISCSLGALYPVITDYPSHPQEFAIDALVQGLRKRLQAIPDPRRAASTIHSQAVCLMAAFAMLMFLAFLVDQVQQLSCPLFAKAMGKFNNLESSHPPSKKPTRLR